MNKAVGATEIEQSLEAELGRNIHELKRAGNVLGDTENADDEISADNLNSLLRRVTELSTCEIENLIKELHSLREKLETDGERIQSDITRYTELSQGVMQLTTIITDNVKRLPSPGL
jgi:hypothetical protein